MELNDEETARCLLKEKRDSLIPDIVDYEKRCFTPYNKNSNKFTPADKITFNIFLRDRSSSDNWTSNDLMGWNQMPLVETTFLKNKNVTNGDLLGHLGFTDDDIYYRKKKVSKSFLRLSFYDTNVPMNQMLLFYSTIFLDANELYGKYIKHIAKKVTNPGIFLVKDDSLGADNLTLTFNVSDKFNRHASSEGFYLYLFPDGITNGVERTIYMKVEFNHAGYGTTLPLILPNNGATLFDFSTEAFPTSLMNIDNGNLKEFYRQLYIPVKIKYDESVKDFIYYFPMCKNSGDTIVFNLFEPKINPVAGSSMSSINPNITYNLVIKPNSITLEPGKKTQLNVTYTTKENGKVTNTDKTILATWSSSAPNIASVSYSGLVTAKGNGTTVITASYEDMSDTCNVSVESYQAKNYNIYVDKSGNITQDSDVHSLPCDIYVDVTWIGSVYFDDNYDGDDDRQEQTGGTEVNHFKAGSTKLLRTATATGGNSFNSWAVLDAITGPKSYEFQHNRDNYKR